MLTILDSFHASIESGLRGRRMVFVRALLPGEFRAVRLARERDEKALIVGL